MTVKEKNEHMEKIDDFIRKQKERIEKIKKKYELKSTLEKKK